MQKNIFHLHDVCCKHSSLTLEDAVNYAIKHGYKTLYWTEHCPVSVPCGYQHRRAPFVQLTDLKNRIEKYNKKYANKLHIYFGYEVEWNKANRWYFEKLARDPLCQFFILGVHFYGDIFKEPWPYDYCINDTHNAKQIDEYLEMFKSGLESGLISWAPHPEIWLNSYAKWNKIAQHAAREIIKKALETKTPLGFNLNFKTLANKSKWHYPSGYFWKLVSKTNAKVIVESDAHALEKITVEWIKQGYDFVKKFGVEKNIVQNIPIKWFPKKPLLLLYEDNLLDNVNKNLINSLKNNNIIFKKIDSKTNLVRICKQLNIHPVWTICLTKNASIFAKAKKTSMYIVSNQKSADLSLNKFNTINYDNFLNNEFIKEVK